MQVPDDEKNFPDVLMLLAAVLNFKAIAKKTAEAVQSKSVKSVPVTESFLNGGDLEIVIQFQNVDYSDEG
ncbi:unnamed protein product [Rhizophagus irregularis]|nr:unnamed protein product [Rhizophagus irregularis]